MTTESLAHLPEPSNHPAAPRPLVDGNRFVLVDDRPICAVCGEPVEPVGPDDWRHVPPGRRSGQNVRRWLAPVSLAELRRLRTYEEFAARYPWAARGSPPALGVTTPTLWREAVRRLGEYERTLRRVRRYPLEAGGNPYLDLVALLAAPLRSGPPPGSTSSGRAPLRWAIPGGLAQVLGLPARRRELAALFAWAIPTEEALTTLARLGPLVEGGAGTGYWAALLQARGVDVVAYDLYPPGAEEPNRFHRTARSWTTVQRATSVEAARRHPDRSLFLCWPPVDDEASYRPLRAYAGEVVAYVGDPASGATGSPMFHRELERNWTLVETVDLAHWPGLRDALFVFRRRPQRQPLRERDRCPTCRRFVKTGTRSRCDACFRRRPPPLALSIAGERIEFSAEDLEAMPPPLRRALERSVRQIR